MNKYITCIKYVVCTLSFGMYFFVSLSVFSEELSREISPNDTALLLPASIQKSLHKEYSDTAMHVSDNTPPHSVDIVKYEDKYTDWYYVPQSDTAIVVSDNTPPHPVDIVINNGDLYTASPFVTLELSAEDDGSGVDRMCFANEDNNYDTPEPYSTKKSKWELSAGNGSKKVYAKFINGVGLESLPASDTITLFIGDFNFDGVVDASDLAIFAANYGKSYTDDPANWPSISACDLSGDDEISASDWNIFGANYGSTRGATKVIKALPTSDVQFSISANVDELTATYFVNVNIDNNESLKGFEFFMSYDHEALEFIENSVSGLVGLSMIHVVEDRIIRVTDWFVDEEFDGTATLGFRSNGLNRILDFEILSALVDDVNGLATVTNLSKSTVRALPTGFSLSRNYPNPFNPETIISYNVPKLSHVTITIYNILGQKIRTLVNRVTTPGSYSVKWNGTDDSDNQVTSGIYVYRMETDNGYVKPHKMLFLK